MHLLSVNENALPAGQGTLDQTNTNHRPYPRFCGVIMMGAMEVVGVMEGVMIGNGGERSNGGVEEGENAPSPRPSPTRGERGGANGGCGRFRERERELRCEIASGGGEGYFTSMTPFMRGWREHEYSYLPG